MEEMKKTTLEWKVHTPNLLAEIMCNQGAWALKIPLQIFGLLLNAVAKRAIELDDAKLHALMLRLTLYSAADPSDANFDPSVLARFENLTDDEPDVAAEPEQFVEGYVVHRHHVQTGKWKSKTTGALHGYAQTRCKHPHPVKNTTTNPDLVTCVVCRRR